MLEEVLDVLIGSEPFERLLASRARPLVARAPAGADFVAAALARALESPILAVTAGPHEAESFGLGVGAWLGPAAVAVMPAWESLPYEGISPSPEIAARRHDAQPGRGQSYPLPGPGLRARRRGALRASDVSRFGPGLLSF